jgi:iron(III) transport system substrate-binding protein
MAALVGCALLAACASAAPARSTAPTAALTAPISPPATRPAGEGLSAERAAASTVAPPADWQAQWDRLVAAARQEGRLALSIQTGDLFRNWAREFERAYPEVQLELTGMAGRDAVTRILGERRVDQYLWDVYVGGPSSAIDGFKAAGALDPLRPALLLPEILDDSKWYGGFDDGFTDRDGQYVYAHRGDIAFSVYVNRDRVPEAELSRVEDLTAPQWKGKLSWQDPTVAGTGAVIAGHLYLELGEEWYRRLMAQEPVVTRDQRQQVDWLVRGQYPIAIGPSNEPIQNYRDQGVGLGVQPLAPDTDAGRRLGLGIAMALFNRAPHPNAARLFINWALSREGQTQWINHLQNQGTRRLDVPMPPELAPDPKAQYPPSLNKEEYAHYVNRATEIAKETIR